MSLIDHSALKQKIGDYYTGKADALADTSILQRVRMRKRQLGQMTMALDRDLAKRRIPSGDYHISRKIDGEFTCLVYKDGEVFTINPGGTIRVGAAFHSEAKELLDASGVSFAILGAELYVRLPDDKRPRVHDVVRVARAPETQEQVDSLCLGVFNIYEWDNEERSGFYADRFDRITELFGAGDRVHPVETVIGDGSKAVLKQFKKWVDGEGAEGVVARNDTAGVFKIKPRHTIDLAAIGFTEGLDDRSGMLHDVMLAVVRSDGSFHIIGRVGGGFSDDERTELLKNLEAKVVDSEYAEVNSDRVAYRMLEPGIVFEISCLDIISTTSRGNTIDKMVLEWDEENRSWIGVRRLPLCSIISPQYVRIRDDKEADADDIHLKQLTDIVEIPSANVVSKELRLPQSELLKRSVATKELRGATMVRKLMMWKTNKEEESRDFSAYVLHLTDFSPNRKDPLKHEVRVSNSKEQIQEYFIEWEKSTLCPVGLPCKSMPSLKILSWNILHGGGTRCDQIIEAIDQSGADIVTLQEFRHGRHSPVLLAGLKSMGLTSIYAPETSSARENSLIIASRLPLQAKRFPEGLSGPARAIEATLEISPTLTINMIAGHFPQKREQVPYFAALQELPARWRREHSLIVGDLNCGIPFEDSQTKTFYATHLFQQLLHSGWQDAWRKRNPDAREFTWISTRKSNGFRYDHALVSAALDELIVGVRYDHSVREKKLSDHSSLLIELDC